MDPALFGEEGPEMETGGSQCKYYYVSINEKVMFSAGNFASVCTL